MLLASLSDCLPAAVMAGCMAMTEVRHPTVNASFVPSKVFLSVPACYLQDGPTPLLHLRSNKTFTLVPDAHDTSTEEPASKLLSALADEGLLLAKVIERDGCHEVQVPCELMADLIAKVREIARNALTANELLQVLNALSDRRQKRIVAWLEANIQHIAQEGDAQRLMMQTKTNARQAGSLGNIFLNTDNLFCFVKYFVAINI